MIHHGALGDFVLALQLTKQLAGDVTFVTTRERAAMLRRFGGWGVIGVDGDAAGFGALFGSQPVLSKEVVDVVGRVDGVVVSFVSTGQDAWAENAARVFAGKPVAYVKSRPPAGHAGHVTAWQAGQLVQQAPGWLGRADRLVPVWKSGAGVVVHPGSGGKAKRWPVERFCELSRRLMQKGSRVRWVVSPDDLEMDARLAGVMEEFDGRVIQSLDGLVDACLGARVWVGNDSGPSHLAALLGVRTVALFGPTDARVWGPIGAKVVAPEAVCAMDWLGVERVVEACG